MGESSCVQAGLTNYSTSTFGRSQVIDLANGGFTPGGCAHGKGGIAIDGLTTDLLGQPRPAGGGTIGAIEIGAGICPRIQRHALRRRPRRSPAAFGRRVSDGSMVPE